MEETFKWYQSLTKPSFAPPSYLFGIVWSILYPVIFISFGYVVYLITQKRLPTYLLIPLAINITSNLLFSPIQFGLQNNVLAAVDITIVLISLVWLVVSLYPHNKTISLVQLPYLLWVAFATVLQYSVTWLNR